jgi:type I phosphodiesterase/nucleotide pyrophosphatase
MPALGRLIRGGAVALHPVPSGLPTSTPAFQAGLMYGGPVDVPGFEFVDKRTGTYRWFPRPWDAAAVEAAHARPGQGIVRGGRTYGCVFGGGADDTVLTFAHVLRSNPAYWGRVGVRALIVPTAILAWLVARMSVVSVGRLLHWLGGTLRDFSLGRRIRSLRRMITQLLIGGWLRELFTLGVTADLYAGVPALYVNFVEYDVAAHEVGPRHREAFRALRGIDRSIARFARVLRRIPEHRYDLFVLSDHGQLPSIPFRTVAGGVSVVETIVSCFGPARTPAPGQAPAAADAQPNQAVAPDDLAPPLPLWPFTGRWQRELACSERPVRERNAVWIAGLCIVPAGPNVNVYLTHTTGRVLAEEIEARHPGALDRLSRHPAIGFVLVRDARGSVCYYRGEVFRIPPHPGPTSCPVFDRPDRDVVVRGLLDLLEMPSGGDVILYGHYTDAGCVNFLDERGSHAGPSEDELYAFMAAPPDLPFDFRAVRRARDLHQLFARYHEGTADD